MKLYILSHTKYGLNNVIIDYVGKNKEKCYDFFKWKFKDTFYDHCLARGTFLEPFETEEEAYATLDALYEKYPPEKFFTKIKNVIDWSYEIHEIETDFNF